MSFLTSQQRNTLEKAVINARKKAEEGAVNILKSLAVDHHEPFAHQTAEQRALRNSLRSKARLLGDVKLSDDRHEMDNLVRELAYEYWHKILFARFLEANNLLMHPTMEVSVTLEELDELAADEGYADKWEAAAAYASKMLPAIFRVEDPLMQITFAPNDRIALESILSALEPDIFTADDALGWVYQFWQTEAKAAINASGDKIDGKRLPAVTQLFTEPYMVNFLIDNTVGAWWVSRNPGVTPPVKFEYLRLLDDGTPAAGKFEGWPDKVAGSNSSPFGGGREGALTSLDPCMGSGHFVCSLFNVFAALRIHEEGLTKEEATDRVIAENLHGLEIDPRCTQIAAFNLALTAWKFCGHYKILPEMNLACSGIAPKGKVDDWVKLVGKVERFEDKARMENGMRALYKHFQLAPELGSLLDPTTIKADAFTASFDQMQPVLKKALENERDNEVLVRGVMAAGIAKAGDLLSKKYTLQITNVPYLSRGKQENTIADYCENNFGEAKGDLATVFMDKMLKSNTPGGTSCSVIPQNWLFLTSYKKLREKLLKNETWSVVARLGTKGFQTPMWDFNVMLIAITHQKPLSNHQFIGLDVSEAANAAAKDEAIRTTEIKTVNQNEQLGNPDARVVIEKSQKGTLLDKYAKALQGIATGDYNSFGRFFWEIKLLDNINWILQQSTFIKTSEYVGKQNVIFWENGKGRMCNSDSARIQGLESKTKYGIAISQMAVLKASLNIKSSFDNNCSVIIPYEESNLLPIWTFCSSDAFNQEVRKIDQKTSVTNATLVKVPFDLEYWQKVAAEKYPNGLPKPYSDDPTQWLFHGHPVNAENALQVAAARLLGYRWPAESEKVEAASSGLKKVDNKNAAGSGIYDTLSDEAKDLIQQVEDLQLPYDEDGIVCIPPVYNEHPGAERLRGLLQKAWGSAWGNNVLAELLKQVGSTKNNLEDWLRDEFFTQHCKVFQNRPFMWHIWDGRKDGFSALVNYHKLDKENLKKLIYTYLGDWIRQCEAKKKAGESGADGLYNAATNLKEKLELILEGENPYDIFVRWKPIEQQPIGWEPDLNDGVRLNIRPFVEAGILRNRFNVKWGIDRGKNPPGSPWGEIRDNDRHLSLEEKKDARENK
jgi:hypothetical protein